MRQNNSEMILLIMVLFIVYKKDVLVDVIRYVYVCRE